MNKIKFVDFINKNGLLHNITMMSKSTLQSDINNMKYGESSEDSI